MGGRGNFEAAIRSVQAFEVAEEEEAEKHKDRSSKKRKHEKHKDRKDRKSSRKHKKGSSGKPRDDGKEKRRKHKRRKESRPSKSKRDASGGSSSDASSDSSEDERGDPRRWNAQARLERGQAAVRVTRNLMARHAGIQDELRGLLRQLDSGEGIDIGGIGDEVLQQGLCALFDNLPLLRVKRAYRRIPGGESLLGLLGPVLQEKVEPLAAKPAAEPEAKQQVKLEVKEEVKEEVSADHGSAAVAMDRATIGTGASGGPKHEEEEEEEWLAEPDDPDEMFVTAGPAGPAMPPPAGPEGDSKLPDESSAEPQGELGASEAGPAPRGPTVGPAMPSREMLEAAAAAAASKAWDTEEEEEEWELIGPPPPEIMMDLEAAGDDARSKEVARVMRTVGDASSAGKPPDAYEVLGVEDTAAKGEIKKKYWKLSLLVHPDKCTHPKAQAAFAAVNEAAKTLQDEATRAKLDQRLEDEELMKKAVEEAKRREQAAQWARMRGEAVPDLPSRPAARETWMTELPPEKQVKAGISLDSMVTSFSKEEKTGRGDTSEWTDTPASRAERLRIGPTGPMALPSAQSAAEVQKHRQLASLVDGYNSQSRAKSLLELHLEKQQKEKKEKKQKKKEAKEKKKGKGKDGKEEEEEEGDEEWVGSHPWRPFDRERDLGPSADLKPKSAEELMKKAGTLSNRFGASGGRSFL